MTKLGDAFENRHYIIRRSAGESEVWRPVAGIGEHSAMTSTGCPTTCNHHHIHRVASEQLVLSSSRVK